MIPQLLALAAAFLAGGLAVVASFAQHAVLSTLAGRDHEHPAGDDYADQALVTRVLQDRHDTWLQLAGARHLGRWLAVGLVGATGLRFGPASALALGALAALLLHALEEELPLRLVLRDPAGWALRMLPPLAWPLRVLRLFDPLLAGAERFGRALVRPRQGLEPPLSVEELTMMAAAGSSDLGAEERRILRGIFRSSTILVADIMTPRDRAVALPADITVEEAIEVFRQKRHSRLPVYDETLDRIAGMAYAKDFLAAAFDPGRRGGPIRPLLRDAYFVREDRRIQELFDELRDGRVHLAVVLDRLGRTRGLVSLEDILEEIVGEIHDELEAEKVR